MLETNNEINFWRFITSIAELNEKNEKNNDKKIDQPLLSKEQFIGKCPNSAIVFAYNK